MEGQPMKQFHPVQQPVAEMELSVKQVKAQLDKVREIMRTVMSDGIHYGAVPGTDKKTLLKPGAEVLCVTFRLAQSYQASIQPEDDHLTVITTCTLTHIPTGNMIATGMGMCSTRESKYAYRKASRKCPACGKEKIVKGKDEYGGGWLCFAKMGGCGAKFKAGDAVIEAQDIGRVDNDDVMDQHNTVLKMSNKRALVAAILNATGASDIFTQDMEDRDDDTAPRRGDPVADARKHLEAATDLPDLAKRWEYPDVKAARMRATQGELKHIVNIKEKLKTNLSETASTHAAAPLGDAALSSAVSGDPTALEKFAARLSEIQTTAQLVEFWNSREVALLAEEMTETTGAWETAKKFHAARKAELMKAETQAKK